MTVAGDILPRAADGGSFKVISEADTLVLPFLRFTSNTKSLSEAKRKGFFNIQIKVFKSKYSNQNI
jgi:hypothetical protein